MTSGGGTGIRERLSRSWRSGVVVRVTNLGLGFILLTLVVAIGATNTGNNGLYVLLSVLLAALVVSAFLSRMNVGRLVPSFEGPDEIFAGEPARFLLRIANGRKWARRAILVKIAGTDAPLLVPLIPGGGEESRGVDLVFTRRGRRRVESLLVYSSYPIGLFRKGRLHQDARERLVYPKATCAPVPRPDARGHEGERARLHRRGRGAEVRNLREAGPGDDPRDIHWPQTARQGSFITKERSSEEGRDAVVALEAVRPAAPSAAWDEAFETALSEATGLVLQLLSRGDRVGLLLGDRLLLPASGPLHRRALLGALALAEPSSDGRSRPAIPRGALVYPVAVRVRGAA